MQISCEADEFSLHFKNHFNKIREWLLNNNVQLNFGVAFVCTINGRYSFLLFNKESLKGTSFYIQRSGVSSNDTHKKILNESFGVSIIFNLDTSIWLFSFWTGLNDDLNKKEKIRGKKRVNEIYSLVSSDWSFDQEMNDKIKGYGHFLRPMPYSLIHCEKVPIGHFRCLTILTFIFPFFFHSFFSLDFDPFPSIIAGSEWKMANKSGMLQLL